MSAEDQHFLAEAYRDFRETLTGSGAKTSERDERERSSELVVQYMWHSGLLGRKGVTERHGRVCLLDSGIWNRGAGADFLHCEIELNGQRLRGDIEITTAASDWERLGCGNDPAYNNVILHVVPEKVPVGWYTRNSLHYEIPVLSIPPKNLRLALGKTSPPDATLTDLCPEPLADVPWERADALLRAAAAFRLTRKRVNFQKRAQCCGIRQTWYECWAETLGYRPNKFAMQMLACRAPLDRLGNRAESILFGTAGFLQPVLPEKAKEEVREYHRRVWDAWWPQRDAFELSHDRALPWVFSPLRPVNHPHRRVAALALSAQRWGEVESNLRLENSSQLMTLLTSMRHPYWDTHCSLVSLPMKRSVALVGEDRVQDFIVNHLCAQDERPAAWEHFMHMKNRQVPTLIRRIALRLFGEMSGVPARLNHCYVQQALLQINEDFCTDDKESGGLFPRQLATWSR